jgi:hypothetical protein
VTKIYVIMSDQKGRLWFYNQHYGWWEEHSRDAEPYLTKYAAEDDVQMIARRSGTKAWVTEL